MQLAQCTEPLQDTTASGTEARGELEARAQLGEAWKRSFGTRTDSGRAHGRPSLALCFTSLLKNSAADHGVWK